MTKLSKELLTIVLVFVSISLYSQNDWPAFHNSDRTNKSAETGLLKTWPDGGPSLEMTISGVGEGYSSIIIADGILYVAGMKDKQSYLYAFTPQGKQLWRKPAGQAWETTMSWAVSYTGTRSTPVYDNGVVYFLGEMGRLTAFDAKTGNEKWRVELLEQFSAPVPEYGYSESVLIDGDRLYCSPAGKKGFITCIDKKTGKILWTNNEIKGGASYNSGVLMDFGGYRQVVSMSSDYVFGVDSKNGKLIWSTGFKNSHELNCTDPLVSGNSVIISSGYGKGSMMINLSSTGADIKPSISWQNTLMDNAHGGLILDDGYIYGTGSESRGLYCLDMKTGKQMWKGEGKGSVTFADGMLYLLEERGIMRLVKITPESYQPAGEFKVPSGGKGPYWAHPVVCGGKLYVRHTDKIFVYNVK